MSVRAAQERGPGTIARLWQRYQRIGIDDGLTAAEARYVRALNGIILIVTGLLWLQLPLIVRLLPDTRYILMTFLAWPVLWQLVPALNHHRRYTAARVVFSTTSLALIAINAVQLGPATQNHFFIMTVPLVGFIIYPPRDSRWLAGILALSAATMIGLEWFYTRHDGLVRFPADFINIVRWSSIAALFLIILAVALYHYRVVVDTEHRLELEHERSESLLLNILPRPIAARLKRRETPIADRIEDASVLFADIIGFTDLAGRVSHERVVEILNTLFSEFDRLAVRHGLEKIKTIGDAYMLAGGLPSEVPGHHAAVARCALDMLAYVRSGPCRDAADLGVRIGIHCGPVVAGVICETKFAYDVWGDTVNVASRMESHGLPNQIQVSAAFRGRTADAFVYEPRGPIEVKGKGLVETFLLRGPSSAPARM